MATFTSFLNVLPDPNYKILSTGKEDATGVAGPGFASLQFNENTKFTRKRTLTGKTINKTSNYHNWSMNIKYNPMTRAQFDPVYNFLLEKKGTLRPFYLSLPQYKQPKDADFITFLTTNTISVASAQNGGVTSMEVTAPGWSTDTYSGLPSFGDLFNITDTSDTLHVKTYMITRVETFLDYASTRPNTTTIRIHFTPGLQKYTTASSVVVFDNPLIQVIQAQDLLEYSLNTENLYSFTLKLEETLR